MRDPSRRREGKGNHQLLTCLQRRNTSLSEFLLEGIRGIQRSQSVNVNTLCTVNISISDLFITKTDDDNTLKGIQSIIIVPKFSVAYEKRVNEIE